MDEVRAFVGHGARALISRGLAATGGLPEDFDIETAFTAFVGYYSDNIAGGSVVYPGLLPLLDRLKSEGFALGICTNKLEGLSIRLIERAGDERTISAPSSAPIPSASPSPTPAPTSRHFAASALTRPTQ